MVPVFFLRVFWYYSALISRGSMKPYLVIARAYRPKTFAEVCGQQAIVQMMKNGIALSRTSHAYLFCGPRGTGKTTLARLFAKALNCEKLNPESEPCNTCRSCKEINEGHSLDVIEVDGASNRGIDDIRQLNETVGYTPSGGKYKVYIIDEVHMLTKEAFNALLKTLEEPPANVKFFLATTEPHKVLPTIVSRCIRFDLARIPLEIIEQKLSKICSDRGVKVEAKALQILGRQAEGSLRDAESMLEQLLCYKSDLLSSDDVQIVFGFPTSKLFERLDEAFAKKEIAQGFMIAKEIAEAGLHFHHVMEGLIDYFKEVLLAHHGLSDSHKAQTKIYSKSECHRILQFLADVYSTKVIQKQVQLEMVFLRVIQIGKEVAIDELLERIDSLESSPSQKGVLELTPPPVFTPKQEETPERIEVPHTQTKSPIHEPMPNPLIVEEVVTVAAPTKMAPSPLSANEKNKIDNIIRFASVEMRGIIK